jgi:hypothetical protein
VQYQVYAPHPRLKPYNRSYFHIHVTDGEFLFPADGCPGLIINLKDPFFLGFDDGQVTAFSGCRLFGASTRRMLTRHQTGQTELLAVKLYPGQIPRFFGIPANELTNSKGDRQ